MKAQSSHPAQRCPHPKHHHQDMELHRRREEWLCWIFLKNVLWSCPSLPVHSYSHWLVYARGQPTCCKGPESKYFSLCRLHGLCCNYSRLTCLCESSQTVRKWITRAVFQHNLTVDTDIWISYSFHVSGHVSSALWLPRKRWQAVIAYTPVISFPDLSNVLLPGLPGTSYYLPFKSTCSILPGQIYPIIPL